MKKFFFLLFCLIIIIFFLLTFVKKKVKDDLAKPIAYPSVTSSPSLSFNPESKEQLSLFVPYWTLQHENFATYDSFLYFGVAPTIKGLNTKETGFVQIDTFFASCTGY